MKRVLVIGAGGFIGGFICAESLRRGYDTTAGVRASTSRRFLDNPELHFLTLDYDSDEALREAFAAEPRFDWIVYNLGATKCANFQDFNRINFEYLRRVLDALEATGRIPERFLLMSSLSALGPAEEDGDYAAMTERTIPQPNTRYGLSKIKAETLLDTRPQIPWIIFRPTGVYGPHEQDYLMMVKCIDRHVDFGVGFKRQELTFIYVEDLVRAIFDALERAPLHRRYNIAEGRSYTQTDFRRIVAGALGRKAVLPVRLPLWAAYVASAVAQKWGQVTLKPSTLNTDKYKIMKQRNWNCSIEAAKADWGFNPQVSLEEGIAEVVRRYRADKEGRK